jgi:hypothetical protein
MSRPTISRPVFWNKATIWDLRLVVYYCQTITGFLMWCALSDERMGLSFTIAANPRQRSHWRVRVPWYSRPYFTVSDSRLPFSSLPTTRRAKVEVFDPTSIRDNLSSKCQSQSHIATDGQSISKSSCRAPSATTDQIFITLWHLRPWFCGAPSLTRGWICILYMLLVLASVDFHGSYSLGTRDHLLLSQIWDFPIRRLLRLAGSRWRYSHPPPCGLSLAESVWVWVTFRLTVSQSVCLGVEPRPGLMTRY